MAGISSIAVIGGLMSNKIFGEAVPTPGAPQPWAAVIYSDEGELTRAVAADKAEAEKLVVYLLAKLAEFARQGFRDDDIDRN